MQYFVSRPVGYLQNDISVYSPTGHFSLNKLEAIFFTGLQLYDFFFFLSWGGGGGRYIPRLHTCLVIANTQA